MVTVYNKKPKIKCLFLVSNYMLKKYGTIRSIERMIIKNKFDCKIK